jgi:hypothetical protein
MSQRLQVLMDERELREIQQIARRNGVTVAEWVRQTLRDARRAASARDPAKKLAAIEGAARHSFPTADIDQMLDEIERGYGDASPE